MNVSGIPVTSRGSLIVNSFLQEDRFMVAGGVSEVSTYFPKLLEEETADTVFASCTQGDPGLLLKSMLQAVRSGRMAHCIILDICDSAAANERNFKYLASYVARFVGRDAAKRVWMKRCRCDGHMWHTAASLSFTRAAVSSALYSSAVMLRAGMYRFRMHAALARIVRHELDFQQGGVPAPELREFADQALKMTVLRNFPDYAVGVDAKMKEKLERRCAEITRLLNGDWRVQCLHHRCVRLPCGRFCCRNRLRA